MKIVDLSVRLYFKLNPLGSLPKNGFFAHLYHHTAILEDGRIQLGILMYSAATIKIQSETLMII